MKNKIFGYARVSNKEQNEERQIIAFKDYGIDEKDYFLNSLLFKIIKIKPKSFIEKEKTLGLMLLENTNYLKNSAVY